MRNQFADLKVGVSIEQVRSLSLDYLQSMRLTEKGAFSGYRYSASTSKPLLYATIAALLTKHLYHSKADVEEELEYLRSFQREDGLFCDPVIQCEEAEREHWWGWTHLTLHALMTLAVYDVPAAHPLRYLERFSSQKDFLSYLENCNWNERVDFTSNELQNVGVMLQYARDYQSSPLAGELLDVLFEVLDEKQDPESGLYGDSRTAEELSRAFQAGYHFWLLYAYDRREVKNLEAIVDAALRTQNVLGGYGVRWHSSACDDIDSIDPLIRFGVPMGYRKREVQQSLSLALGQILSNFNPDGGWVFRRHESLRVVHEQMESAENESNVFYTWFRTLGLAYCLVGLEERPSQFEYDWGFEHAPGHQFLGS